LSWDEDERSRISERALAELEGPLAGSWAGELLTEMQAHEKWRREQRPLWTKQKAERQSAHRELHRRLQDAAKNRRREGREAALRREKRREDRKRILRELEELPLEQRWEFVINSERPPDYFSATWIKETMDAVAPLSEELSNQVIAMLSERRKSEWFDFRCYLQHMESLR
jgi:hypothetical protein